MHEHTHSSVVSRRVTSSAWLALGAMMILTVAVYWPSLYGGYLFDDRFYLENPDVHVTTLDLRDWTRAALSQAGSHQFRALSMLSLAANYYFSGEDPFWLKLTNVGIHLLNGLLLFLVLRELLRLWSSVRQTPGQAPIGIIAAVVAGMWLLLPINLTAVAYVMQRLESLANAFVFLGLFWYLRERRRLYAGEGSAASVWTSLVVCMALGYSAKESGAVLPLYTAGVEFAVTRFRNNDGHISRPVMWAHVALLVLPAIAGLIWLSTWAFSGIASYREFSIGERVLTEARVLVDYILWTLLPNLNSLTFYHDDMAISHGLLDPPTTLAAIVVLLGLLAVALWQRAARPLFCLGILWFFAGHALTASVIPLELVFEHRNYFPSVGLLLASASLLVLEPGLHRLAARWTIATVFIVFFAMTTFLRAQEWSHPLRLAYSEALKRPASARAQYELARTLLVAAGEDKKSPLIGESIRILQKSAFLPTSGIAPLQALIFINGRDHRPIDPEWWREIVRKLHDHAPSQTDIDAIIFLFRCQLRGDCPQQPHEMLDVFSAALEKSNGDVNLMAAYSDFALQTLGDAELAERMSRAVVAAKPQVPVFRENLIRLLVATRQFDAADTAIRELATLNYAGSLDSTIAALKAATEAARSAPPAFPQNP